MPYFTGSVPLYMLVGSEIGFDELAMRWTATDLYIDPADYTKLNNTTAIVNAWFEAKIDDNPGPTGPSLGAFTLELIDETDTVRATITTDGIITRHAKRYRVPFNFDTTAPHTYRLRNGGETNSFNLTCNDALVVLDVEDAYRVKLMVGLLASGDGSTTFPFAEGTEAGCNEDLWCFITSDLTYAPGSVDYGDPGGQNYWVGKFLKDASQFATIENWEFEGLAHQFLFAADPGDGGEATQPGYMALFNATTNQQVVGTELTFPNGTSRQSVQFANDAVNFDDLNEFEPRFKVANTDESLAVVRVIVYVQLTAATKAEYVVGRVLNGDSIPFATPDINTQSGRYFHDGSKFPEGTKFFYELTGQQRGNTVPVARINDAGEADYGDQSAIGTPTAASSISGSWSNVGNAGDDGQAGGLPASIAALFSSSISGAVAELQQTGFTFNPAVPSGVNITQVNYFLRFILDGQPATISLKVNGEAFHDKTLQESVDLGGGNFIISVTLYDPTEDTGWLVADFVTATVNIKCTHPANTTPTDFWIAGGQLFVGWADTLTDSELTYDSTARVRKRSGELTLIDGHRYTALHPGSAISTNKIDHANGLMLAQVEVTPDIDSSSSSEGRAFVSTCPLPRARVGEAYTYQFEWTGGGSPVIVKGHLPPGWTLSPSGLLSSNGPVTAAMRGGFQFQLELSG